MHTLDKEVTQSYFLVWGVLGQSHLSFSAATMALAFITVITTVMLVLCVHKIEVNQLLFTCIFKCHLLDSMQLSLIHLFCIFSAWPTIGKVV